MMSDGQQIWQIPEPEPVTDWARIAVLQTERAYLDRELIRAGNHTRATPTPDSKRYYAINDLIRKELDT